MPPATRKRPPAVKAAPAPDADDGDSNEPVAFELDFERDGEMETVKFLARPRFTYKRIREAAKAQSKGGVDAVMRFEKMIVPSLCDDDGVPAKWTPTAAGGTFTDPDGNERDVKELAALLAPEAGSSRRRWMYLMDEDDDAEPDLDSLVAAYERLVEVANERPMQRSKSS